MSTQFQLQLTNNKSNTSKFVPVSTHFPAVSFSNTNHNNANPIKLETKLHDSLQTIMDLQQSLVAEKETNNLLQKERDDFVSITESLSVQLESAQTQIKILNEETTLDKQKLNELTESIEQQKRETISAIDTLQTISSAHRASVNPDADELKNQNDECDNKYNENDVVCKYKNAIETLRNELMEKSKKIDGLCNSLDEMQSMKETNDNLQNEIKKLQKMTKDDFTNQVATIEKFETENNELINMNLQLNDERDQLLNQINHQSTHDEITRAQYDLKYHPLVRRGSNASNTSYASTTVFTSNLLLTNELDCELSHDDDTFTPAAVSKHELNKQDLILNNIIHEYNTRLTKVNQEKEILAAQLNTMMEMKGFKARKSGCDEEIDDGYVNEEEDVEEEEKRVVIMRESDIDNDNGFEEIYSVCDYTTISSANSNNTNDIEAELDHDEKLIQENKSDCNLGGNALLIVKKFLSKLPFSNS